MAAHSEVKTWVNWSPYLWLSIRKSKCMPFGTQGDTQPMMVSQGYGDRELTADPFKVTHKLGVGVNASVPARRRESLVYMSLVYTVSSRTARAIEKVPVSKEQKRKQVIHKVKCQDSYLQSQPFGS